MNLYVRKIRMINGLPWLEGKRIRDKKVYPSLLYLNSPSPPSLYRICGVSPDLFDAFFNPLSLNERTEKLRRKKKVKRNKRKIPPPFPFLFRCSFSSFSTTPHYNTAFVVVSASNLHVTRRVEYGERRHWLRGKPVGGARTPHSLSASRGWKRGNTIKKEREREAVLAKCQSGGITIFRFEFLLEI